MKNFISRFSIKQIVLALITLVALLVLIVLLILSDRLEKGLADQIAASRWASDGSCAQVSCFFAENVEIDLNQIYSFRNQIETGLKEASLESDTPARLYADAYSSQGTITLEGSKSKLDAAAVGVGGDFFLFHPLKLLNGSYFWGTDLMQDYIIIDEDAAWQLFGSNEVIGMSVLIKGVPHYIAGVIGKEEGRMWEAAGLEQGTVYMSEESLSAYGITTGIKCYEAVMPNPVSGFAYRLVKEKFGFDEYEMEVVDNTHRYDLEPMIGVIADFGIRSMQHRAIQYPYWENYAKGFEDILSSILIFEILFLFIVLCIIIVVSIKLWRRKTWTWRSALENGKKLLILGKERIKERAHGEKNRWKDF